MSFEIDIAPVELLVAVLSSIVQLTAAFFVLLFVSIWDIFF